MTKWSTYDLLVLIMGRINSAWKWEPWWIPLLVDQMKIISLPILHQVPLLRNALTSLLSSYLAFWGPTVSSVKEDDALSCASSMEPDSMPSGAMHWAAKSRKKVWPLALRSGSLDCSKWSLSLSELSISLNDLRVCSSGSCPKYQRQPGTEICHKVWSIKCVRP